METEHDPSAADREGAEDKNTQQQLDDLVMDNEVNK